MRRQNVVLASVLAAGAFFSYGWRGKLPASLTVDGQNVGGMMPQAAEVLLRNRIAAEIPPFTVSSPAGEYVFTYPEIGFCDNLVTLLEQAKRNGDYRTQVTYYLKGAAEVARRICFDNQTTPQDAEVSFGVAGFSYTPERNGYVFDAEGLQADILQSLNHGFSPVVLTGKEKCATVTEGELRERTVLLSEFSTAFCGSSAGRVRNIRLAAARLDGATLLPGQRVSFNQTVGKRTEENGFAVATVIDGGVFVRGVGGGVCQVSTTLYNAVLRAGLQVECSRAHTLTVGYVPPSLDAMVSETSDFVFVNQRTTPVYLSCKAEGETLSVKLYGKSDGKRYLPQSVVTKILPAPDAEIRFGTEEKILRMGKDGCKSESFLLVYEGERLCERRPLRQDIYAPIQGIEQKVL